MAIDRSAINGAAVNQGSLVVVLAAVSAVASLSVAAAPSRVQFLEANPTGVATGDVGTLYQLHQGAVDAQAPAAVYSFPTTLAVGEADAQAGATVIAAHAPIPGGCAASALGTAVAAVTYKVRAATSAVSSSSAIAAAYRDVPGVIDAHGVGVCDAEPGVKLSGDSFWTFEATGTIDAFGTVSFAASGIKIQPTLAAFFGYGTVQPDITYKHRVSANMQSAAALVPGPYQTHYLGSVPAAVSLVAAPNPTRRPMAEVRSSSQVKPLAAATVFRHAEAKLYEDSDERVFVEVVGSAYVIHFPGYPDPVVEASAVASPIAIYAGAATASSFLSIGVYAEAAIEADDVMTFLRPADQREHVRPADARTFTRTPT